MSSESDTIDKARHAQRATPQVFQIKHNSIEDGPGIRSVIFLKGCNLDCGWCHNPESKKSGNELFFDQNACVACGACVDACPENALRSETSADGGFALLGVDRKACTTCLRCADVCPSRALSAVGREMSVDDLADAVLPYRSFFQTSGGGVTVSGGEPTLFMPFLSALLQRLKAAELHTLIETNGRFHLESFERSVLPYTDMIYMDMKFLDRQKHKQFCGVFNDVIVENFIALHRMSGSGTFTILPRTPLIPGITDTDENVREIAQFYQSHSVTRTVVLKSNPLWSEKHRKLGIGLPRRQPPANLYDSGRLRALVDIYAEYGVTAVVG